MRYSVNAGFADSSVRYKTLVLGGSTAEEKILNKEDTWIYQLLRDLNRCKKAIDTSPVRLSLIDSAVNGHSVGANYLDVVYWISRFKQSYSTANIYQGINLIQEDILEEMGWHDLY